MPINFHAAANHESYATRGASDGWRTAVRELVDVRGKRVVDVGCGGGIYACAWAGLGAAHVAGVDFSAEQVAAARAHSASYPNVTFTQGEAAATGLPDACADLVFARALLHHLSDLAPAVREAARLLVPGGMYLAQDRTPDDVALSGSPEHLRGYFFARFPRLREFELARRPRREAVLGAMEAAGFQGVTHQTLWETRRVYPTFDALADDLRARTGRSLLHELSDAELDALIAYLRERLPATHIAERDRWTLWWGTR